MKVTRAHSVFGKRSNLWIDEASDEEVEDAFFSNEFVEERSRTIKAGTTAAFAAASYGKKKGGDGGHRIIPRDKCVLIEFTRDATLYENDNGVVITDGENHIMTFDGDVFRAPGKGDASVRIEREDEFDLVCVRMDETLSRDDRVKAHSKAVQKASPFEFRLIVGDLLVRLEDLEAMVTEETPAD